MCIRDRKAVNDGDVDVAGVANAFVLEARLVLVASDGVDETRFVHVASSTSCDTATAIPSSPDVASAIATTPSCIVGSFTAAVLLRSVLRVVDLQVNVLTAFATQYPAGVPLRFQSNQAADYYSLRRG